MGKGGGDARGMGVEGSANWIDTAQTLKGMNKQDVLFHRVDLPSGIC